MAEKNVSRRTCVRGKAPGKGGREGEEGEEGDMCRRLRRNLSRGLFLFTLDVVEAARGRQYLGCREILQDHAQVETPLVKLRNIPGRANRSMR